VGSTQFKEKIRRQVLKKRKLERTGKGHLGPTVDKGDPNKTLAMRLVEAQRGVMIEELLSEGSLKEVALELGIKESTVSLWRKRLGLRL
jgi:DNA-binding NarL/FixJ family response regulator